MCISCLRQEWEPISRAFKARQKKKKTAWFLGTVRYIEFAKEFKTMLDHLAIQS